MMYPVTVKCNNIVECTVRSDWAAEHDMNLVNRTWEVVNKIQHVTFNFDKQEDALLFALRWAR